MSRKTYIGNGQYCYTENCKRHTQTASEEALLKATEATQKAADKAKEGNPEDYLNYREQHEKLTKLTKLADSSKVFAQTEIGSNYNQNTLKIDDSTQLYSMQATKPHTIRENGNIYNIEAGDYVSRNQNNRITGVFEGDPTTENWSSVNHDRIKRIVKSGTKITNQTK